MAFPQLFRAIRSNNTDRALQIIQTNPTLINERSVNTRLDEDDGETVLITAIKRGNLPVVEALLARGADPNRKKGLRTPLFFASDLIPNPNNLEIVKRLFQYGADPNIGCPIVKAVRSNNYPVVKLIAEHEDFFFNDRTLDQINPSLQRTPFLDPRIKTLLKNLGTRYLISLNRSLKKNPRASSQRLLKNELLNGIDEDNLEKVLQSIEKGVEFDYDKLQTRIKQNMSPKNAEFLKIYFLNYLLPHYQHSGVLPQVGAGGGRGISTQQRQLIQQGAQQYATQFKPKKTKTKSQQVLQQTSKTLSFDNFSLLKDLLG